VVTLLELPDDVGPGRTACLDLYSRLAAGVTVVTARGDDGPTGMTASSVTSVSLRPPLLLVSLALQSRTLAAIRARRTFAVHLLRSDQRDLAERFAGGSTARFHGQPHRDTLGAPVLPDVLAWSVCLLEAEHVYGDHALVIGRVASAQASSGRPLLWHGRSFSELAS
jgi:flavin reductase (DIM6/NTAB) family NADH-FMN oxidoreductase RutF